ncbi:MAG: aldehyde dehydrogenase family protein [Myxococcota bacterium]
MTRGRLLRRGDYVYGSFFKPETIDGYINGVNPGDRADILGRFPFSESSIDEAVEYAVLGARTWRRVELDERLQRIRRFRDHLSRFQERTARLVSRETGKPLWESRQEVVATVRAVDLFVEDGQPLLAPRILDEIGARSEPLPRGVVGIICPYSFPVMLPVTYAIAALMSGNAVVVKPSKFTPGVGQALAALWDRCRLPRGVYNMIQGPGSVVGQRLVTHPQLDVLLFAGSYSSAAAIRRLTAERPELPMLLQCGGKGQAIVLEDADLERAVYEVIVGAFLTAGQRHNSTARVLIADAIYDTFARELKQRARKLTVGYGFGKDVFMGPLISENLRTRYLRFSRKLAGEGHRPLLEAAHAAPDHRGFYAKPAVYEINWNDGAAMLEQEPPGPMLLMYRVQSWEEAAALHNQAAFRGATSLFTQVDNPLLPEMQERLRTGALNINRGTIGASLRLPSVGLGRSANGLPAGVDLIRLLTHPRAQLIEDRPLQENQAALPGLNWGVVDEETTSAESVKLPEPPPLLPHIGEDSELEVTEKIVDGEEDDLVDVSASLELTAE